MGQDSDEEAVIAKPKEEARLSSVSCLWMCFNYMQAFYDTCSSICVPCREVTCDMFAVRQEEATAAQGPCVPACPESDGWPGSCKGCQQGQSGEGEMREQNMYVVFDGSGQRFCAGELWAVCWPTEASSSGAGWERHCWWCQGKEEKGQASHTKKIFYFLINLISIIFRVYVEDAAEYVTYLSQGTYEMKHGSAEVVMPWPNYLSHSKLLPWTPMTITV